MGACGRRRTAEWTRRCRDAGTSFLACKRVTQAGCDAVMASEDVAALATMRGYVRSYAGPSGGLIFSLVGAPAAWAMGYPEVAAGLFGIAGALGYLVMEIRRRSRMWEAVIDARLAQLGAG